jgi:hypothetical protein
MRAEIATDLGKVASLGPEVISDRREAGTTASKAWICTGRGQWHPQS